MFLDYLHGLLGSIAPKMVRLHLERLQRLVPRLIVLARVQFVPSQDAVSSHRTDSASTARYSRPLTSSPRPWPQYARTYGDVGRLGFIREHGGILIGACEVPFVVQLGKSQRGVTIGQITVFLEGR